MDRREFLTGFGFLIMILGMAMGDSESLLIPAIMIVSGGLMALKNVPTGGNQ